MLLLLLLIVVIIFLLLPSMDSFTVGKGRVMNPAVRYWLSGAVFLVMITTPLVNTLLAPVFLKGDALRMGGFLIGVTYDVLALIAVIIIAKVTSTPVRTDGTPVPLPSPTETVESQVSSEAENEAEREPAATELGEPVGEPETVPGPLTLTPDSTVSDASGGKPAWMIPAVVIGALTVIVAGAYFVTGKANSAPAYTFTAAGASLTPYTGADAPIAEELTLQEYEDNDYVAYVDNEYTRVTESPSILFNMDYTFGADPSMTIDGYRTGDLLRYTVTAEDASVVFYVSTSEGTSCGRRVTSSSPDTEAADKEATWQCSSVFTDILYSIVDLFLTLNPREGLIEDSSSPETLTVDSAGSPVSLIVVTKDPAEPGSEMMYSYVLPDGDTVLLRLSQTSGGQFGSESSAEVTAGTVKSTVSFSDLKRR